MRINIFKYIFILFVIILVIVAYTIYKKNDTQNQNETVAQNEETVNIVKDLRLAIAEFDTINPILSNNKNVQEISKLIYDSLVTLDENYNVQCCLASEISKTNETTYVVKLKENITWSDGTPFTANDVKFTVDTIKADNVNSIYKENLKRVLKLDVIDYQTLSFTLDREEPFFEYNLTFPIMSSLYYKDTDFTNTDKNNNPIGTGKYKIDSYDTNVIVLSQNEKYWNSDSKCIIQKININIYSSIGEVYNAFKNGNIDILNTTEGNAKKYIGTIGYNIVDYRGRQLDFIAFNSNNNILSSNSVRRAISYYIDRNNIISSCYGSEYNIADFPLDYGSWIYENGKVNIKYNVDEAKSILEADGWTYNSNYWRKKINGKTVRLSFGLTINSENELDNKIAENIKNQLAQNGITVNIKKVSSTNYYNYINDKNGYDAILVNMNTSLSPNISTYIGDGNISNYTNEEIKQIMKDINNITDYSLLKEKYNRIIEIYNQDVPFLGIARNKNIVIYNTNLMGVIKPTNYTIFNNINMWYRKNY